MGKKILIIGAGFSGATFARMAVDKGHNAHIVDQKDHVGGNSYSYKDQETGIEIHKYGPHIFHTNSEQVYKFVTRFTKLNNYINRVKAISSGQVYSLPINLHTINQFFGKNFSPKEAETFIKNKRIKFDKINRILNFETKFNLQYALNEIQDFFLKNPNNSYMDKKYSNVTNFEYGILNVLSMDV